MNRIYKILLVGFFSLVLTLAFMPILAAQGNTVAVQLIALNDLHGNLEPANLTFTLPDGQRIPAGGAEYLATHINQLRRKNPRTLLVSAGDSIGATPLLSALFHDEPTIEALDAMKLDVNAVGNHEFDQGAAELLRLQKGGCHPQDGCRDNQRFGGAKFQYLAANVINEKTGKTILPPYKIYTFDGVKIAFIGMTLEGTPKIVSQRGIVGLRFQNEADTVNALVPELQKQGIKAIVVLVHEGGLPTGGFNECPSISGAIVEIVKRTHPEVDLFITGHTHQAYNCVVEGRAVTSAASFGRLVTDINLTLDRRTKDVRTIQANNLIVTQDVPKNNALTRLIDQYKALADPLANRVIGQITADFLRTASPSGEMPLGNLIADAQLSATRAPDQGGAVVALMNPGGIRAELTYVPPGNVTYGQAFAVQPFGNNLVTMTLTGAQIKALLEQQFDNPVAGQNRILQVSQGFGYRWSVAAPLGNRVQNITLNGQAIIPSQTYRVTVNSFLADGGDNFTVLRQGQDRLGGVTDVVAWETYFRTQSPLSPPALGRIQN
ncbi:5'-nucleotidase family protein [Gloeomargarita lithophora Alchichica-D10]|uniref:5'-nucleotidase family protein n=1 Tax=Gloeomargarita lithophora Alchichica-D10 TaxID=1188229 RepID=A0A1J0AG68_9CYAN|nr:bifunctional metallophosphatase/5'-nucleotidase [Gloeomargarita lithophora]APB34932.1 5'-nucleotidase family protein [Gloeomargarita lithophora Alchichica-D10]